MQILQTGELKELPVPSDFLAMPGRAQRAALQAAADKVIPERRDQKPIFMLGETLEIRGGKFRVFSINPKKRTITFESLPR